MMQREGPPPPRLTRRALALIALLAGVVATLMAIALLGFELQSAVRAYVNGESLWTKGQKEATLHLLRFAREGEPAELDRFTAALKVPYGDRVAREQLELPEPDMALVRQGFLLGGNHPDDVDRMADAYRRARRIWFVDSAITIWATADTWIDSLTATASHLAAVRPTVEFGADTTMALVARINAIDNELTTLEREFSRVLGEGARWTQQVLSLLIVAIGALLIAVGGVITWRAFRRIRAEEEARRASEAALAAQLRHSQKMEAVTQLTGSIAHDFNNLLTIVTANAEMLAGHPALDDASTQRNLDELTRAARRGASLVRRLLALSQRDALRLEPTDLAAVLEEFLPTLRRLLPAPITLESEVTPGLPWVQADPDALQQALQNLVLNASEAMPAGGTIRVTARAGDDSTVIVAVHDTGEGMDAAVRARAFEPFFTTRHASAGSGLGLAMVEALVRQLGATIALESEPGRGTTVTIRLRAVAAADPSRAAAHEATSEGRGELILVAEDEDALRRTARRVLVGAGYRVREAANGREALDQLREDPAAVDLVLSDLLMPEMGGRELLRAARAAGLPHRFLFMSGYSPDGRQDGEEGTVPLLSKPWTVAELLTAVHRRLGED